MGASVTSRALDLLGAFDPEHRSLTLSALARRAGLPLATAHRLAGELHRWGALDREPSGAYVIGRRLWNLGLLAPVQADLRQAASPFLHDLYGATLATVHLAVRDGAEVLYVDRLAGHVSVPVVSRTGSRLPMHATGVGKVLLAYAPAEVRTTVLARLERITPYTVTQPARLVEQLRRVRAEGFATTGEEMSLGACSVAVPVRVSDADEDVVAALGIVLPDLRRERVRLVSALQVAASGIGRTLAASAQRN
jgi:DNA-binding IclR family transcriptional regulator